MNTDRGYQLSSKQQRAHFFSSKELQLMMKLYEEERPILTAKSNTLKASKEREEAWQRMADKINESSDSGYKRSWMQVKVKYKNIVQTARRRADAMRKEAGSVTPSLTSAEEDVPQQEDNRLRMEVLPGGACIEPLVGSDNCFISVSGHPVLLLPVTKTEPESLSEDETDVSDIQYEVDGHSSSFQQTAETAYATNGSRSEEKKPDDIKALYCCYLKKEMENRDQQMAFRALKMRKLEKEILLLDKQLM